MKMKHFITTFLLLTLSLITKAQKDSFWLRNLNLMGEPKAVFALDDGYSIVLADSFDQISQQYKSIIFFKLDPNGKMVKRKQLFKLDTTYLEQRLEKAEKLDDGYLFRWYYTSYENDSVVTSKSYFAKVDANGGILQNEETVVNYFGKAGIYWYLLNNDTILDLPIPNASGLLRYSSIKSGLKIDSFKGKPFPPASIQNKRLFFISKKRKENYDSIWITSFNFKYERIKRITNNINSELDIFHVAEHFKSGWLFLSTNNELIQTDTNLNILWQTPPEFIKAVEEEITDVHILNNGDIIVIGNTQMANGEYTPYFTSVTGDGSMRKFQYSMPSFINDYHSFSEGPNSELYFLVSNRNETYLAKISPWGQLSSIKEETKALEIQVYPNPTSEKINVKFSRQISGHISIISMKGIEMQTFQIENKRTTKMDLSDFPSGSYYLLVKPKDGSVYSKMLFKP